MPLAPGPIFQDHPDPRVLRVREGLLAGAVARVALHDDHLDLHPGIVFSIRRSMVVPKVATSL